MTAIPVQEQLTFTARTVAPGEELNQVNCGNLVKKKWIEYHVHCNSLITTQIMYSVFRENYVFHNPLQPIPRLHIDFKRSSKFQCNASIESN